MACYIYVTTLLYDSLSISTTSTVNDAAADVTLLSQFASENYALSVQGFSKSGFMLFYAT
ncbi:MAG: hypothetical protein COA74_10765 [Gammaproteobacteria bacterium]|nr:MAG: hypothetical protein COA74_10765 [Gammaproteobacteria bacterium]